MEINNEGNTRNYQRCLTLFCLLILTACSPSREQIAATMAVQAIEARGTATAAIEQAVSVALTEAASVTNKPLPTVAPTLTPDFQKTQVSLTATEQSRPQYLADLDPEFITYGSGKFAGFHARRFVFDKTIASLFDRPLGYYKGDLIEDRIGITYLHGIWIDAPSKLTYRLNGAYSGFRATLTIGRSPGMCLRAWFSVDLDGRRVYYSPALLIVNYPIDIDIDITGATLLTLKTHVGDFGCDATIWGDPILVLSTIPLPIPSETP